MKIATLSLFCLFVVSPLFAQDSEFHLDESYKISKGGTITLKSSDAKVYISSSNRNDVHVKIDRTYETKGLSWGDRSFTVEVDESNGNLDIIERQKGSVTMMGYSSEKYEIWIEAPKWVNLDIDGDDDDYEIRDINGDVKLKVDDGDVNLVNCKGRYFKFQMDDGDLTMDAGSGSLQIDSDDGDVTVKNGSFDQINADVDDGSFLIETTLSDGGDYEFKGDDSRFTLVVLGGGGEFDIRHDDASVRATSVFDIVKEDDSRTVIRLPRGNANIRFRTDDGSVRLSTL